MIFNYNYGCCVFAHNIYGSQPVVPDGMPDTFKSLSPKFFINPRCSPGAVLAEVVTIDAHSGEAMIASEREVPTAILEEDISEAGEYLSTAEVGLYNEPDSFAIVTKESEELDVFGGS